MERKKIKSKMTVIAILLMNFISFSCNFITKNNDNIISDMKEKVTIYDYQVWASDLDKKELRDSAITYIDTLYFNNRKNIIFAENDSISLYYSYAIEKDSFFLENIYSPNIDTIYLRYKHDEIELIKSSYDVENSIDEEMYVYWNYAYGLVALYNYPWGGLILFEKESMRGFTKEIFYDYIINQEKINRDG
jgi:hypothetical protein